MSWPEPQDYNEAVQNPAANFSDVELKNTRPELTPLGLPRPITGNFASVYRMSGSTRDLAVRCFFRDFSTMARRYSAISTHLDRARLSYQVGFHYLGSGIRVHGRSYPLLKMEWVEGRLLDDYIKSNLSHPRRLTALAAAWLELSQTLRLARVAHGDLQHGNVIVAGTAIKLVDYDGVWVPELSDLKGLELGHPNYQHPGRDSSLFGPNLDNFSHWVIYTSVLALAADPGLWTELKAGDERLLLGRWDFENHLSSPAFDRLVGHRDSRVRRHAGALRSFLDLAPHEVPVLQDYESARPRLLGPSGRARTARDQADSTALPEWLRTHVWKPALAFNPVPSRGRRVVAFAPIPVLVLELLPTPGLAADPMIRLELGAALVTADVGWLLWWYARQPLAWAKLRLQVSYALKLRRLVMLDRAIARSEARLAAGPFGAKETAIAASRWSRRQASVEQQVRDSLRDLRLAKADMERDRQEANSKALTALRSGHVEASLRRAGLIRAPMRNVGLLTKVRLWCEGVRTARDINTFNGRLLDSLSGKQSRSLMSWHDGIVRQAERSTPQVLPERNTLRITRRHERRLRRIDRLRRRILAEAAPVLRALGELDRAAQTRRTERGLLRSERASARENQMSAAYAELLARRARDLRALDEDGRELDRYALVTFPRFLKSAVWFGNRSSGQAAS